MTRFERISVCLAAGCVVGLGGCMVPKADYDAAVARSRDLQAKVYSLESSLAVTKKALADARTVLGEQAQVLAGKLEAAQADTAKVKAQVSNLAAERDAVLLEARAAQARCDDLKADLNHEIRQFAELQAKLAALAERVEQLRAKVKGPEDKGGKDRSP